MNLQYFSTRFFPYISLCVAPVSFIVLLFFIKRRMLWLAVPGSVIVNVICFWSLLKGYEFRGFAIFLIIYHAIMVSIVTGLVMFSCHLWQERYRRLQPVQAAQFKRRTVITFVCCCVIVIAGVVWFAAHTIYADTSIEYNESLDRKAFEKMIILTEDDIAELDLWSINDVASIDKSLFFKNLIYDGGTFNRPIPPPSTYLGCGGRIVLKNGSVIVFWMEEGENIRFEYNKRRFCAKSDELWKELNERLDPNRKGAGLADNEKGS